jgi:hypothetical protein
MDLEKFNEIREELDDHCSKLLEVKKAEYATDKDRLIQFKKSGALESCHPVRALTGKMAKHETSIHDMVNIVNSGQSFTASVWIEKIGDLRNYCDLLYALLYDTGEI